MAEDQDKVGSGRATTRTWEPMALTYVGEVGEMLRHGGGKHSILGGDPGEPPRKPPGAGPT